MDLAMSANVKVIGGAAAFGVSAYIAKNSVLFTDAGMIYVCQNNLSGSLDVYSEPGLHARMPFFSSVTAYTQICTVNFEDDEPGRQLVVVRFADTYAGTIPVSFRFKLPTDPDQVRKIHREFRSQRNLIETLLNRNAKNVTVITATQYTGEEFFQGGLNQFKTQLADQLNNGIYETVRPCLYVSAFSARA